MPWTNLSFSFGANLTSNEMNQLYDNADLLRFDSANVEVFTASGTWTKPTDLQGVYVIVIGGGGGGAARGNNGDPCSPGAGGGAAIKWIDEASLGATETVTVGGGGAGAAGSGDGTAGSDSSFGSHCTGGGGGEGLSGSNPSTGGIGTSGDVNLRGQSMGVVNVNTTGFPGGGAGYLGSFGRYDANADSPGAGGAALRPTAGNGADGIVVVINYF